MVSRQAERRKLTRWEILGAWLRVWTPPRDADIPPIPWRTVVLGAIGTAAFAGIAAALIVPPLEEGKRRGEERRAAERAAIVRANIKRLREDQRIHVATVAAGGGTTLVDALRRQITADSRGRVAAGKLDGPILRTDCEPASPGVAIRPGTRVYKCLAATSGYSKRPSRYGYRTRTGYSFVATIDYRRRTLTWCKYNPKPGEKFVRGNGYVPLSRRCAGSLSEVL